MNMERLSTGPMAFFDQSQQQAENIIKAATAKRKANREKGNP